MSDAVWPRLAAPFGADAVAWIPVEVAEAGDEVRVVPLVARDALRERLDRTVGVGGWGVVYAPLDGGALACHVTVAGVTKGAVVPAALVGGAAATADAAFARAAELFGLRAPFPSAAMAWVPCDADTLVPLHLPEVEAVPDVARPADELVGRGAPAASEGARAATSASAPVAGAPTAGAPSAGTAPAVAEKPVAEKPVAEKPTGQQMIDRLVDRLKDEGQGLAAARLLVRHGGYGKDPDTARELYAQLRALLRGETAASAGPSGGGG